MKLTIKQQISYGAIQKIYYLHNYIFHSILFHLWHTLSILLYRLTSIIH